MNPRALEKFTRSLLGLLGGTKPERDCLDEATLAALATGERLPLRERRRASRHASRCPACMEKLLLLRELEGRASEPLFQPGPARWAWSPAWRPLASAAALALVAGLLYLGGVTFQRLSVREAPELAKVPAVEAPAGTPSAPPAETRAAPAPATTAADRRRAEGFAATGAKGGGAAADKKEAAVPGVVGGIQPLTLAEREAEAETPTEETKKAHRDEFAPEPAAPAPAAPSDLARNQAARDHEKDEAVVQSRLAEPSPAPAAAAPAGSEQKMNMAAREEGGAPARTAAKPERAKRERPDLPGRLAALCRAAAPDDPEVHWMGKTFRRVRGELVEEGACEALGRRPVDYARPEDAARFRRSPGYDSAWRGIWILTPDAILLIE